MLSSHALDGSRKAPCVATHESAGPHCGSTNEFQRKCPVSRFAIPFTDGPVGIQTILLVESGRSARDLACDDADFDSTLAPRSSHMDTEWSEHQPFGRTCDQQDAHLELVG